MAKIIKGLAGEVCSNHLAMVLEGGYNLTALAASVKATFEVLLGQDNIEDPHGPSAPWRAATQYLASNPAYQGYPRSGKLDL